MAIEDRRELSRSVDVLSFHAGANIYKHGDAGDRFFVVVRGAVEELEDRVDEVSGALVCNTGALYLAGQYFGEQSLVAETCYPSSTTCLGD